MLHVASTVQLQSWFTIGITHNISQQVIRLNLLSETLQHHCSQLQRVFSTASANITAANSPTLFFLNCLWDDRTKDIQSSVVMSSFVLFVFVSWISMMPYSTLAEGECRKISSMWLWICFLFLCLAWQSDVFSPAYGILTKVRVRGIHKIWHVQALSLQ